MFRIVISTGNENKVREISDVLKEFDVDVVSKDSLGLNHINIEEDGHTLEENAIKKARELWKNTGGIVIADDTGLFVNYLKGDPGVHSSRYAGDQANDIDNNNLLLKNMKNVEGKERKAFFKTVIVIIDRNEKIHLSEGICCGQIGLEPKGDYGFGYDSLFVVDGIGRTFAQMSNEEKNKYSHRGKALRKLGKIFSEILYETH
ncbi:MAG: Non-canonical purine NTP pyrophosphatase [Clostridiales bacterium 38_11]|nr:MAG: Non-canonical purine NTP pyrophosphatase [Clostridiales bacterium 38_11]HBH12531.1 non-canonical purine NTP pyrophosphatase, RdgB/HAM1 family [Clostridiales bacterium]